MSVQLLQVMTLVKAAKLPIIACSDGGVRHSSIPESSVGLMDIYDHITYLISHYDLLL